MYTNSQRIFCSHVDKNSPEMAMLCFPPKSSPLFFSASSSPLLPSPSAGFRRSGVGFAVFSSHSNPRILKSTRRSRTGRLISPYDDEDDDKDDDEEEDEDESEEREDDLSDVEDQFSDRKLSKIYSTEPNRKPGQHQVLRKGRQNRLLESAQSFRLSNGSLKVDGEIISKKIDHQYNLGRSYEMEHVDLENAKQKNSNFAKSKFQKLAEEIDFDEKWFPLIEYLSTFGLKDSHLISIYERHMPCLQINLSSAQERLEFLLSVGVKHKDIKRILMRQPQILEYTVENNLKSHVAFLVSIGVPHSRIGQIITAAPSLFSYSIEHSLKPTVRYLVEEVGIKTSDISKVVQLSPQVLVQRIDNSWTSRFSFLSKELGAPKDSIVKMVTKHPQLLHYSIEDGILPRINFLRSIGMCNSDILKVLTSLAQVLSLSLERNLKPKYLYLVNELRNEVKSLTKYPMYLSLSLEQRIRPRHRFLVSLKKAPKGPFPLSSLVPSDECFCQQWAGTSLEKYLAFRQSLQLTDFAKKYQRKV
ncbi:transcription termination factor MTERF9, chloroplastic-like isoform X1 [Musa acuminata AAA Group]|uniref:transcription termination factor MTERF9, chloroplastic-like isoform X1 n=1 Tax=Musa acuminata AAA Group TaxID=214697 RepID=UPI0031D13B7E